MSSLMIRDLSGTRELDRRAMSGIAGGTGSNVPMPSGGYGGLGSLAGIANVNVTINQNLVQQQNVDVAALNNVGVIGAGFVPLKLNVDPTLWGGNFSAV
ncbi:hypothetical protein BJG93_22790 [Paraburkholderia sprentiae WSM5005]|uniref:Uncharacterized protein n=1 Tax=Paraburkholderia sprentiae WSM5005 TaxID=754502 RepID=A0A1I9YPI0_9BURK|nr:hypothetical protein [Paraburkholderia sprentiae]APA88213.1 hypothetical protein BJG93_22790 [Paraburkholderia sprentiae WSM5005]